jgi:hypothetical protein
MACFYVDITDEAPMILLFAIHNLLAVRLAELMRFADAT